MGKEFPRYDRVDPADGRDGIETLHKPTSARPGTYLYG
jgi:hypothetical protein